MIRIALLGCGRISQKHIQAISSLEKKLGACKLVAVCDLVKDRADKWSKELSVPAFRSLNEMIVRMSNEIDVVSILTPSGLHAEHTVEVAKHGKHVIVEKPMALTLSDADAMISACDAAGVRLFVVKQNRYNAAVQKARSALESGRFGKLVMGTVRVRWCRTQQYYDQAPWRGTWALDGGVFSNQASHHVDLLQWMLGDVESVYAVSRTALVDIEAEDTGIATLKFKNGSLGIIEATTATRPKDLEGSLSILGENGTVEIGGFAVNEMKVWNFINPEPSDAGVVGGVVEKPDNVYGFGHQHYYENVIESLKSQKRALVDGLEGRRSLELISAIYESIETGLPVQLRFKPERCRLGIRT
jgi:UDP-N-acetyl-2-amino-2-deoxyglucuronate dehydrogenase